MSYKLLIITNEKKELILNISTEDINSEIPMFLAYATLDGNIENYENKFVSYLFRCPTGHRIIIVSTKSNVIRSNLIKDIESVLNQNIMDPYCTDQNPISEISKNRISEMLKSD